MVLLSILTYFKTNREHNFMASEAGQENFKNQASLSIFNCKKYRWNALI